MGQDVSDSQNIPGVNIVRDNIKQIICDGIYGLFGWDCIYYMEWHMADQIQYYGRTINNLNIKDGSVY